MQPARRFPDELERLPFVRAFPPLAVGILWAVRFPLPPWTLLWLLGGSMGAVLLFHGYKARPGFLLLSLFLLGAASAAIRSPASSLPGNERIAVVCEITDTPLIRGRWQQVPARIIAFRKAGDSSGVWQPVAEQVLLHVDTARPVRTGDLVGAFTYFHPFGQPNQAESYEQTMRSRGFTGKAYVTARQWRGTAGRKTDYTISEKIMRLSRRIQKAIGKTLTETLEERERSVAAALLAGDKTLLTPDMRDTYSKAGISHILAISGLHLGILFLLLNGLLTPLVFLRRGREIRSGLIVPILWAYAFITGLSPSVMRAAFMFSVMQFSLHTLQRYSSYNALFASAFILTLINPLVLWDISFRLSHLALLSIIFFHPRLRRWSGTGRAARRLHRKEKRAEGFLRYGIRGGGWMFLFTADTILMGMAAQIGVTPLIAHAFGRIPLLNLLVNPVILPLVTLVMGTGLFYLLTVGLPVGTWPGTVLSGLLNIQNVIAEKTAAFPLASIEIAPFPKEVLSLIYFLLTASVFFIKFAEMPRRPKTETNVQKR